MKRGEGCGWKKNVQKVAFHNSHTEFLFIHVEKGKKYQMKSNAMDGWKCFGEKFLKQELCEHHKEKTRKNEILFYVIEYGIIFVIYYK